MINNVISYCERLYGKRDWTNYDSVLCRLAVDPKDSCSGILPSNDGTDYNPEPPILAAKFAVAQGFEHILAIANEDGMLAFQDTAHSAVTDEEASQPLTGRQCHHNAIFDLAWMPNNTQIISASGDHTARLWDFEDNRPIPIRIFSGHTRSLRTICFRPDDPAVFSTGGRDGAIFIWDVRCAAGVSGYQTRADDVISVCHGVASTTPSQNRKKTRGCSTPGSGGLCSNLSRPHTITGLVFRDSFDLISSGAGDGIIKIWDLRKTYSNAKREPLPKHSLHYPGTSTRRGFSNLILDNTSSKLYANCMDNRIYCYNASGGNSRPISVYSGLENSTFYIKSAISADGRYLISGSSDERAYIWNIDWPTPLVALEGHAAEVTCVAWCTYGEPKIVTCSDDAKHKVWRVGSENMDNALLRGQSKKIATYTNASKNSDALEYTPKSVKRWVGRSEKTPSTGSNIKTKIQCDICESRTPIIDHTQKRKCVQCEILNAQSSGRTLKRNSSDMLGTSDVEEDQAPDKKRIHLENRGARRLFEPGTSTDLSTIMEENEPGCSTSLNPMTPVCDRDKSLFSTPQSSRALTFNSPTANLPNYVLSGEAPHLRNISPKKKCKENIDWLTKIIKQKRLYDHFSSTVDNAKEFGSSSSQIEESPKVHGSPARKIGRNKSGSDNILKTSKSENTLLKFFTVVKREQSLHQE